MANVEKNMAKSILMETKMANMERNVARDIAEIKTDIEGNLEATNNEVRGLKTALIEGFDEVKDVLVKIEGKIEENARKVRNTPSGDRENIIVAGGEGTGSVEMFNWRQKHGRHYNPCQRSVGERLHLFTTIM